MFRKLAIGYALFAALGLATAGALTGCGAVAQSNDEDVVEPNTHAPTYAVSVQMPAVDASTPTILPQNLPSCWPGCPDPAHIGAPDPQNRGLAVAQPSNTGTLVPADRLSCWPNCPDPDHMGRPDPSATTVTTQGTTQVAPMLDAGNLVPEDRLACWPNCPLPENIPPADPQAVR